MCHRVDSQLIHVLIFIIGQHVESHGWIAIKLTNNYGRSQKSDKLNYHPPVSISSSLAQLFERISLIKMPNTQITHKKRIQV
jgi:hypothetical protein